MSGGALRSDAEALARLREREGTPTLAALGLRFTEVDVAGGRVCAELDPREDQQNQTGSIHGGVLAHVADAVAGAGVLSGLPDEDWCATLELNVSYLRRYRTPPLVAEARALHRGLRTHVWEVDLRDGRERLLARARATFLRGRGGPV